MKKYLFLNTVNRKQPSFILFDGQGKPLLAEDFIDKQEAAAKKLIEFFRKAKIKKQQISAVLVLEGPGSFSGGRAGVVLANAFNFLYGIPIKGAKDSGAPAEEQIKSNLAKIKKVKKTSRAKVYYPQPPNIIRKSRQ